MAGKRLVLTLNSEFFKQYGSKVHSFTFSSYRLFATPVRLAKYFENCISSLHAAAMLEHGLPPTWRPLIAYHILSRGFKSRITQPTDIDGYYFVAAAGVQETKQY